MLEEIKEMIENQKEDKTTSNQKVKEETIEKPQVPQERRKLYATKYGEKYHFEQFCKGFNGNQSFEWKSCMTCKPKTERILDLSNSGSSSSTEVRATDDTLVFEARGPDYHAEDCTVRRTWAKGNTDKKKTLCQICAKEERLLIWARSQYSTSERK